MNRLKIILIVAAALAAFSLLLLIISVGMPVWLDDGTGNTVGLFRQCYGDNPVTYAIGASPGCFNNNQVTQGGLSIFGLLLLVGAIAATIVLIFKPISIVMFVALGLLYFSSMFVMAAYATWGTYSRSLSLFSLVYNIPSSVVYTSMGSSYHLCVAAHYFLWTALTVLAFGVGFELGRNDPAAA